MRIAKLSKSVQVSSETKIVMRSRELMFDKKKIKTLQAMLFVFAGNNLKIRTVYFGTCWLYCSCTLAFKDSN